MKDLVLCAYYQSDWLPTCSYTFEISGGGEIYFSSIIICIVTEKYYIKDYIPLFRYNTSKYFVLR